VLSTQQSPLRSTIKYCDGGILRRRREVLEVGRIV
jgi:hypothetical protein